MEILVNHGASPLKEIINKLSSKLAARTLRDDLAYLKKLNLVSLEGFGRSAKWGLVLSEEKK